jgi:hypothetical protein
MKSKKQSAANSGPQKPQPEIAFFVDRSLGRCVVADALRRAGEKVVVHDDVFAPDVFDEEWLRRAGAEGWIVLTNEDS